MLGDNVYFSTDLLNPSPATPHLPPYLPPSVSQNKRPGRGSGPVSADPPPCRGLLLIERPQTGRLCKTALIHLFIELFTWRGGKCDTLYRVSTVMSVSQPIWKQRPRSSRWAAELFFLFEPRGRGKNLWSFVNTRMKRKLLQCGLFLPVWLFIFFFSFFSPVYRNLNE